MSQIMFNVNVLSGKTNDRFEILSLEMIIIEVKELQEINQCCNVLNVSYSKTNAPSALK